MRGFAAASFFLFLVVLVPIRDAFAGDASLNLYEWLRPAPIVLVAEMNDKAGKHHYLDVVQPIRGSVEPGTEISVLVRRANLNRDDEDLPLKLEPQITYILLLQEVRSGADQPRTFELVRGVHGAREAPAEARGPFVEAARLFAQIQDADDHDLAWHRLEMMLEEVNPLLIETALQQYHRYRRGKPELLPTVRPLMEHPRPAIRAAAIDLIGFILERHPGNQIDDRDEIEGEVIGHARHDPVVAVRIAATEALGPLRSPGIESVVEEISEEDPDQEVRYAAEVLLYQWSLLDEAGRQP